MKCEKTFQEVYRNQCVKAIVGFTGIAVCNILLWERFKAALGMLIVVNGVEEF